MTKIHTLPDLILSAIFIYSSNPSLAWTCRTFYIIACSTTTRAQWLLHRYKDTRRAAHRGVHWRFFNCQVLHWLESKYAKEAKALLEMKETAGAYKQTRSSKRAKLLVDGVNGMPIQSDGVGDIMPLRSDLPLDMISFRDREIPCWLFSNQISRVYGSTHHASFGSLTEPQHLILAQALLTRGASPNTAKGYPLVKSASMGRLDTVRQLLDAGADIAANGNRALFEAAKAGHIQVVEELIRRGAHPDTKALQVAVESGHWRAVDVLVAYGAEPDINVLNAF